MIEQALAGCILYECLGRIILSNPVFALLASYFSFGFGFLRRLTSFIYAIVCAKEK